MPLSIEVEQEADGRWLAEVPELPGVLTYGQTRKEAIDHVQALVLRLLADRFDHGEPVPPLEIPLPVVDPKQGQDQATRFQRYLSPEFTQGLLEHMHRAKHKAILEEQEPK